VIESEHERRTCGSLGSDSSQWPADCPLPLRTTLDPSNGRIVQTYPSDARYDASRRDVSDVSKSIDVNSGLSKDLAAAGLLEKSKKRFVVQRPIFSGAKGNKGHCSVYAFKASILDATS
jgi:hypothetical protein